MQLKLLYKNKIIIYLLTRYGSYALQFIVSMVIAAKLGPYYLGVYGFITLILNYFSQINLGVPHSLNVLMVHNKTNQQKCDNYIGNSIAIYALISLIVILVFLFIFFTGISISNKFPLSIYHCFLISIIAIAQYYSSLCSTILRVKNRVNQLAIAQSSLVLLNLFVIFFFNGQRLIYVLLICQLLSLLICIFLTWYEKLIPNICNIRLRKDLLKEILHKGFFLFLYNSCFYFILISIRTVISGNYTIEEFGLFNFSYTLAHAVLLLIEALNTIIFPKIIDLLSSKDYKKIEQTISTIRVSFVSTSHLLIYVALLFFPLIIILMPKFNGALTSMNLIALSILMNTNSYGYSSFLIAQNKERISARISFIALITNIVFAGILANIFHVDFSFVVLSIMITYLCFSLMVVAEGKKVMGTFSWKSTLKGFFPIRLLIPYSTALFISVIECQNLIFIPLLLFIILNVNDLKAMGKLGVKLIKNPNITNI